MSLREAASIFFIAWGVLFFLAGTVGLLRFPDVFSRLHALTKADNLGLGLVILGVGLGLGGWAVALKLFLIWILTLVSSATACFLVAESALRMGIEPEERS